MNETVETITQAVIVDGDRYTLTEDNFTAYGHTYTSHFVTQGTKILGRVTLSANGCFWMAKGLGHADYCGCNHGRRDDAIQCLKYQAKHQVSR